MVVRTGIRVLVRVTALPVAARSFPDVVLARARAIGVGLGLSSFLA